MAENKTYFGLKTKNKYPLARKVSSSPDEETSVVNSEQIQKGTKILSYNYNNNPVMHSASNSVQSSNSSIDYRSVLLQDSPWKDNLSTYRVAKQILENRLNSPASHTNTPNSQTEETAPKYSQFTLKALQDARSKITSAGRYQDRYKNEFSSVKQNMLSNHYMSNQKSVTKNDDLASFKLVQHATTAASACSTPQPKNKTSKEKIFEELDSKLAIINKELSEKIKISQHSNLVRCKTPDPTKEKSLDNKDKLNSIDTLSRIEAHINNLEANILKKDMNKPNIYGEHENLLKSGISNLSTNNQNDDSSNFDRGTRSRNSTGGTTHFIGTNAEAKLGRHASDSQDRPLPRIRKNIPPPPPLKKTVSLKYPVQVI